MKKIMIGLGVLVIAFSLFGIARPAFSDVWSVQATNVAGELYFDDSEKTQFATDRPGVAQWFGFSFPYDSLSTPAGVYGPDYKFTEYATVIITGYATFDTEGSSLVAVRGNLSISLESEPRFYYEGDPEAYTNWINLVEFYLGPGNITNIWGNAVEGGFATNPFHDLNDHVSYWYWGDEEQEAAQNPPGINLVVPALIGTSWSLSWSEAHSPQPAVGSVNYATLYTGFGGPTGVPEPATVLSFLFGMFGFAVKRFIRK